MDTGALKSISGYHWPNNKVKNSCKGQVWVCFRKICTITASSVMNSRQACVPPQLYLVYSARFLYQGRCRVGFSEKLLEASPMSDGANVSWLQCRQLSRTECVKLKHLAGRANRSAGSRPFTNFIDYKFYPEYMYLWQWTQRRPS